MHLYSHPLGLQHRVPQGHPERPERLTAVLKHLAQSGLSQDFQAREPQPASTAQILRAHASTLLEALDSTTPETDEEYVPVDPDTWLSQHSVAAARCAVGAVCQGIDDLLEGHTQRVFCAVRPPGHHAEHDAAMGFCLFNSIAIGALHALSQPGIERVAILDFDVHHGNGSVDICKDNPAVLVCSSFQHPHYPNRLFDVERPNVVNTPLAAGTDGKGFRQAIERDWLPALDLHKPDLILVSAGFDAHQLDPLASLNLLEEDFTWVTELIVDAALAHSQGRVLSTLEGGYDLSALAHSVEAHLLALRD